MNWNLGLWVVLALWGAGCGKVGSSSSTKAKDAYPTGATVRAQGNFQALNDSSIGGSASVLQSTEGRILIRLESLSGPTSLSGLKVALVAGGTDAFLASLKATQGNQNYQTGAEAALAGGSIEIRDVRKTPPNDVLARALLISTPIPPGFTGE